jgi:hypothetical protein
MRRPHRPATGCDRSRLWKLGAQETAPPSPNPCSGPEHRQFDFWLGEWEVRRERPSSEDPAAEVTHRITWQEAGEQRR